MSISKRKRCLLGILAVALILGGLFAGHVLCTAEKFRGERIETADRFLLDAEEFNGTDGCTLQLQKDQRLKVQMQVEKGEMTLTIADAAGAPLYQGNGGTCSEFLLNVSEAGAHSVSVTGHHARGRIEIAVLAAAEE